MEILKRFNGLRVKLMEEENKIDPRKREFLEGHLRILVAAEKLGVPRMNFSEVWQCLGGEWSSYIVFAFNPRRPNQASYARVKKVDIGNRPNLLTLSPCLCSLFGFRDLNFSLYVTAGRKIFNGVIVRQYFDVRTQQKLSFDELNKLTRSCRDIYALNILNKNLEVQQTAYFHFNSREFFKNNSFFLEGIPVAFIDPGRRIITTSSSLQQRHHPFK